MVLGTIMKKAVCIRDWRRAKLKEGEFSGGARSGKLSGCKIFKLHHCYISSKILNNKSTQYSGSVQQVPPTIGFKFRVNKCVQHLSLIRLLSPIQMFPKDPKNIKRSPKSLESLDFLISNCQLLAGGCFFC